MLNYEWRPGQPLAQFNINPTENQNIQNNNEVVLPPQVENNVPFNEQELPQINYKNFTDNHQGADNPLEQDLSDGNHDEINNLHGQDQEADTDDESTNLNEDNHNDKKIKE